MTDHKNIFTIFFGRPFEAGAFCFVWPPRRENHPREIPEICSRTMYINA